MRRYSSCESESFALRVDFVSEREIRCVRMILIEKGEVPETACCRANFFLRS